MQVKFLPGVIHKKIRKERQDIKEKKERQSTRSIVEAQEAELLKGQHRKKYSLTIVSLASHSPLLAHPEYNYLSLQYPELQPFLLHKSQNSSLSWHDAGSSYTLTKVLLHHFYGVTYWQMDYTTHLVPMVGQRINYLHWVTQQYQFYFGRHSGLTLLDIGCGVSLIFGILALRAYQAKSVIASDIDSQVLHSAQEIINKNELAITLRLQNNPKEYLHNILKEGEEVDLVVSNPPFFEDLKEQYKTEYRDSHLTTGEGQCQGGEYAFVTGLFHESKHYKHQVRLFSCMVGVKKHFESLKDFFIGRLQEGEIMRLQMAKLEQGQNARWAIIWLLD